MLKRVAVLIFLLLANCSSAEAGRKSASADLRPRLDAQLEANGRQYGIPAQSVLIMHNGKVLYRKQTGLADVESNRPVRANDIYGAYSVSKLFLSTLVFELADEGRLDLAAPAGRYVAEVPEAWRQVSVEQLLNHASGLPDFFEGPESLVSFPPTRDELFRSLAGRPFYFEPGTQSRYTQTNYVLLQAVLEELHGRSCAQPHCRTVGPAECLPRLCRSVIIWLETKVRALNLKPSSKSLKSLGAAAHVAGALLRRYLTQATSASGQNR
jgi:D-alanyl-D-alanine carboxypeptidase